jgi:hypothetical protein
MSNIITLTELQSYTGQTLDPAKGAQVVSAVNSYVEGVTGRSWGGDAVEATETHDYAPSIFLRHQDVVEVSKVETAQGSEQRTTLDADGYFFNDSGRLTLSSVRYGFRPIKDYIHVTYTYGATDVPGDLKLAALALGSDYYTYADDGQKQITSEGIDSYKLSYASGSETSTGTLHFNTINRYRTRRV